MKRRVVIAVVLAVIVGGVARPQTAKPVAIDHSEDERILRDMIAKRQANLIGDAAVWMGQYERPFLLRDKATAQNDPANQNRKTIW